MFGVSRSQMGIADRERAPRGEGSDPEAEQDALDAYSATVTSVAAQELPQSPCDRALGHRPGPRGVGSCHDLFSAVTMRYSQSRTRWPGEESGRADAFAWATRSARRASRPSGPSALAAMWVGP